MSNRMVADTPLYDRMSRRILPLWAAWEDNLTARSFYPDEIKDDVQVIPVDTVIDLILDAGVTTAPGGVDDPA